MNHYFITGATGNIGSALVPLLYNQENKIHLLIRANDDKHLKQRFEELCSFWGIPFEEASKSIFSHRGDMTLPRFDLEEELYSRLAAECTHIIHCGGIVRMNLPLEDARKSAIGTAKEIVKLAKLAQQNGQLKKIDFVSTVGVIGKSKNILKEEPVTEKREFHNTYEEAKAEAEEYLFDFMLNNSLPITIHRPSMVIGDSKTGKVISFQIFYHICEFIAGKRTFGLLPRLTGAKLDIIPVDYVVEIIAWSAENPATAGLFLHECAGEKEAIQISDLQEQLKKHPYFCRQNIQIPLKYFNFIISGLCLVLPEKSSRVLKTLPHFLNYLDDPQEFSDNTTSTALSGTSIKKEKFSDYINNIFYFYFSAQKKDDNH